MGRSKKNNKKRNNRKPKVEEKPYPYVVGPDLFLLLQGQLFHDGNSSDGNAGGKNVSLILCGESHNDAVDVRISSADNLPAWLSAQMTVQRVPDAQ